MIEKRRSKRIKAHLELNVSNLFKQDNVSVGALESPITVVDVSKHGIGFKSTDIIPLDYYFNASLKLGSELDCLYCVVKIIRCVPTDDHEFLDGCEFVGMAPILNYIFDEYEKKVEGSEK
jgi:hypothetical protein